MRIVFGLLGLLVVVAIVMNIAQKQLHAVRALPSAASAPVAGEKGTRLDRMPGAVAGDSTGLTVPEQSRSMQNQVANEVGQSLQQGAARSEGR